MTYRNPDKWPVDRYVVDTVNVEDDGGFTVTGESGWTFGVTPSEAAGKPVPVKGQEIILLGGFGQIIRGIFIGGIEYRYKTKAEAEAEREEWLADYERRKDENFYSNIKEWVDRKNALDEPFRKRLDRFANKSGFKEFWTEDGGYELFTVEQANALLKQAQYKADDPVVWLDWFKGVSWETQKEEFPGLDEGHSGNTFSGMVALARRVASGEEI